MEKNMHFFPGGNTAYGFVNYFDSIIPKNEPNNRVYVLKGGPGVGKNSFMKATAAAAGDRGYTA